MKKIRDAQTIIGMLEGGETAAALGTNITETLQKLNALATTPKKTVKGFVTLKLSFEVQNGTVSVDADIESKTPKEARKSSFYWVTEDGSLSTEHPQQQDMFAGPREARAAE